MSNVLPPQGDDSQGGRSNASGSSPPPAPEAATITPTAKPTTVEAKAHNPLAHKSVEQLAKIAEKNHELARDAIVAGIKKGFAFAVKAGEALVIAKDKYASENRKSATGKSWSQWSEENIAIPTSTRGFYMSQYNNRDIIIAEADEDFEEITQRQARRIVARLKANAAATTPTATQSDTEQPPQPYRAEPNPQPNIEGNPTKQPGQIPLREVPPPKRVTVEPVTHEEPDTIEVLSNTLEVIKKMDAGEIARQRTRLMQLQQIVEPLNNLLARLLIDPQANVWR